MPKNAMSWVQEYREREPRAFGRCGVTLRPPEPPRVLSDRDRLDLLCQQVALEQLDSLRKVLHRIT
jgi:hypothetical protein